MMLEDVARMYGTRSDYMDMNTFTIYKFTGMFYNEEDDETIVPATNMSGIFLGVVRMKGNWTDGKDK